MKITLSKDDVSRLLEGNHELTIGLTNAVVKEVLTERTLNIVRSLVNTEVDRIVKGILSTLDINKLLVERYSDEIRVTVQKMITDRTEQVIKSLS